MTRHSLLASLFFLLPALSFAQSYSGPIFDAHLHYNDDAVGHYSIGAVHELFSKNGVRAILANSRPNDGTRALVEAAQRGVRRGRDGAGNQNDLKVVPFIRVYRNRDDYGTWFRNPDILAMIVEEEKRGYYRGVGEFHVFGKDADTKVLKDIVDFAVAKGLVLHAHCDEEALETLYRHNPKARVIWAHTGFTTPLPRVEELLVKYPQLWGELSYRMDVVEDRKLNEDWRKLFIRHPSRFVAGSDTWVNQRWQSYPEGGRADRLEERGAAVRGRIMRKCALAPI
jgi:hypothetical protein